ncbi:MAG: hypothetical protein ABI655_13005 [Phenylobacterium sp.]
MPDADKNPRDHTAQRETKLAAALRANLRRRKAADRAEPLARPAREEGEKS